jgi:MFS family permease
MTADVILSVMSATAQPARAPRLDLRRRAGVIAVVFGFVVVLGFTTVPTPLWSLYASRDGLSPLVVTVVFAAYALGVVASLFLAGHVSDWFGRRPVFLAALALNLVACAIFLTQTQLAGLIAARFLSGLGIGVATATATAWLVELQDGTGRRGDVLAVAANLGGLGSGALVAGILAQSTSEPLTVPFLVYMPGLVAAMLLTWSTPETRPRLRPLPAYRPQRVSVPAHARGPFFAAAAAAAVTFAVFGLLTSLAPRFLSGTLHHDSKALAGTVAFTVFAAAAVAQIVARSSEPRVLLARAIPAVVLGLALMTGAVWLTDPSLSVFLAGVIVGGAGCGLLFKGAIATVSGIAAPHQRAEALAGVFLAGYLGLAGPIVGLGLLTQSFSTKLSLLLFAATLATGVVAATPWLMRQPNGEGH